MSGWGPSARRLGLMLSLGFASGLPYALTGSTLSAWMSSAGVPLATIGVFSLVSLPYSLKFLWAPLLDRERRRGAAVDGRDRCRGSVVGLPRLGRRRGWMLACQLGLILAIAALGAASPAAPTTIAVLALVVAALSASQDIASDAYRTDLLGPSERATGTSTFILGYRLALLVSGGVALVLADHLPFQVVYALMALLLLPGVLTTWFAPTPTGVEPPRSLYDAVVDPLVDYFRRPGAVAVLLFITLYRLGDVLANNMVMPFLLALHYSKSEVGVGYKIAGTAATLLGTLGGGALVARWGLYRALLTFGLLQGLANLTYAALAVARHSRALLLAAVGLDQLCTGLAIAALDVFLMVQCNRRFSATQFALLASASGVAGRLCGAGAGYAVAALGWPLFFVSTWLLALPALLILWHLQRSGKILDRGE